jgi:hypothetical protein
MGYKISCERGDKVLSFEISGDISNHFDAIALYVRARMIQAKTDGTLVDIRKAKGRPSVGKLFLHILKYPPVRRGRVALIDLEENHTFCSAYELLARRRGYEIRSFPHSDVGSAWLLADRVNTEGKHVRRFLARLKAWPQILLPQKASNGI